MQKILCGYSLVRRQVLDKVVARRMIGILALVAFQSAVGSEVLLFADDFNRADGLVGNDWRLTNGNLVSDLVIKDGALTTTQHPGSNSNLAGIFHSVNSGYDDITLSGTLTHQNGFGGSPHRYESGYIIGTDGGLFDGYQVLFRRSDDAFQNSNVTLSYDGTILAGIASPFQFGASLSTSLTYSVSDGRFYGSASDSQNTFNFDFGAQSIKADVRNVGLLLESADPRAASLIETTFDNFAVLGLKHGAGPELSPLQLANVADAAYGNDLLVPVGYVEINLPSLLCSEIGFCAKAYISADGGRIAMAIRGTDSLQDWLADASFISPTGSPTPTLDQYVEQAVAGLIAVASAYPGADISLTGHSLGGAIAQLLGDTTGYRTVTFNAPGAAQIVDKLSGLEALKVLHGPSMQEEIVNYRMYGDLVSTVGNQLGDTVTFEPPIHRIQVDLFPGGTAKAFHTLLLMQERLFENAETTTSAGPTAASVAGSILSAFIKPTVGKGIQLGVQGTVLAGSPYFADPEGMNLYLFEGDVGSPNFRSVLFPYLYLSESKFRLELFDGESWQSIGLFDELTSYDFGMEGVDRFRFFILDGDSLLPAEGVEAFNIGVTFVSDGFFSGTLTAESTFERNAVPEPPTALLIFASLLIFPVFLSRRFNYWPGN